MVSTRPGVAEVWRWLADVADPEIPVISIVDLGIVRAVAWTDGGATQTLAVTITPTYCGCPAMRTIERDIEEALRVRGIERVDVTVSLTPPWTTDWLSSAAREKLHAYGIAPPGGRRSDVIELFTFAAEAVACPRCRSLDTSETSRFGSTPCKALYRCNVCREPFDAFKCH